MSKSNQTQPNVTHSRYNVTRIHCHGKESLRRQLGKPFHIDTKGQLKCVTNADETFHAGIKTVMDTKTERPILVYGI